MKTSNLDRHGVHTGEEPEALRIQRENKEALLRQAEGDLEEEEADVPTRVDTTRASRPVRPAAAPPAKATPKTSKLMLEFDSFTLELEVYDINIRPHFIVFSLPQNSPSFEPKDMVKFTITHGGRKYPVIYVGGNFDFPSHNLRAMGFLRDLDKEPDDDQKQ